MMNRKGQVWVSAVLYLLITGIIMVVLLEAGIPVLEKARDKSIYDRERDQFLNLNQYKKTPSESKSIWDGVHISSQLHQTAEASSIPSVRIRKAKMSLTS